MTMAVHGRHATGSRASGTFTITNDRTRRLTIAALPRDIKRHKRLHYMPETLERSQDSGVKTFRG